MSYGYRFRYISLALIVPCSLLFATSLLLYFANLFDEGDRYLEIAQSFPVVMVMVQALFKTTVILPNRERIQTIVMDLADLWPERKNLRKKQVITFDCHLRRLYIYNTVFYWMNIAGSWQYILTPLVRVLIQRWVLGNEGEFTFPFGCYIPFRSQDTWLRYLSVYAFQAYGMMKFVYCLLAPELLIVTVCGHLSLLLTLLKDDLLNYEIERDATINTSENTLKTFVQKHQQIIKLSEQVDCVFNKIIFVDLLFATVTICFFGTMVKTVRDSSEMARNLVGVVASILPIFNLCYFGQLLIDASTDLANAAFFNMWYIRNKTYKKLIFIILIKSQKACCVRFYYSPITLNTFSAVLRMTWSFFSLASQMYEE